MTCIRCSVLFLLVGVGSVLALPVVVIERQSVQLAITGAAWGIQEGQGQTYTATAAGGGTLSGLAQWTVTTPVQDPWLPLELRAESRGALATVVSESLFSSVGWLYANTFDNVGVPFAHLYATASMIFEVEFRVATETAYSLNLRQSANHSGGGFLESFYELPWFRLARIGGDELVATRGELVEGSEFGFSGVGVLAPGSYRMSYLANSTVLGDPLGESSDVRYDMSLAFLSRTDQGSTAVPDPGAYAWGLALVGWWMMGGRPPRRGAGGMTKSE